MLFNSITFLIFYLIVTTLYFVLNHKYRWALLLIASCYFYMFFIPEYILILFATIVVDYFAGIYIEKAKSESQKKNLLIISVVTTCLILFYFKYYNFLIENIDLLSAKLHLPLDINRASIILPIGLSFHTFQSLSYVIEVFKGRFKAEKHFGIYSLYVMYYPQLVAGPIERPQNVLHQFYQKVEFDVNRFFSGLYLIFWGLFKKVVVADRLSTFVDAVYNNSEHHSGSSLAAATVLFALQIYCDFSGYSDVARGASRTMGIELMVNFRRPYFARSVTEFWRRWHISLSTWFRDYLYISLGGSKISVPRTYINLFVTFLISGLWHGANWTFVVWGGLNGVMLIIEKLWYSAFPVKNGIVKLLRSVTGYIYTFLFICLTWIFFRATSIEQSLVIVKKIVFDKGSFFTQKNDFWFYALLGIAILFCVDWIQENKRGYLKVFQSHTILKYAGIVILFLLLTLFGSNKESQFIYFQF